MLKDEVIDITEHALFRTALMLVSASASLLGGAGWVLSHLIPVLESTANSLNDFVQRKIEEANRKASSRNPPERGKAVKPNKLTEEEAKVASSVDIVESSTPEEHPGVDESGKDKGRTAVYCNPTPEEEVTPESKGEETSVVIEMSHSEQDNGSTPAPLLQKEGQVVSGKTKVHPEAASELVSNDDPYTNPNLYGETKQPTSSSVEPSMDEGSQREQNNP